MGGKKGKRDGEEMYRERERRWEEGGEKRENRGVEEGQGIGLRKGVIKKRRGWKEMEEKVGNTFVKGNKKKE